MINVFHPADFRFEPAARLQRLGLVHRVFEDVDVIELTTATCDLVYLVPLEVMDDPIWSRLRVRFARANRPYVVWMEKVETREVARGMRDGALDVVSTYDSDERWREAVNRVTEHQSVWLQL